MKTFFKDYWQLCKNTFGFYKKHWLGTIIATFVTYGVCALVFLPKELKIDFVDDIKSKFKKDSKEEEEVE